ncbi:unnamed protein product [Citrullus colocynthis]|uniref:Uncharacterized protein n=1 Tax=Citrullus colocynthis TaxID=252529 RepID=A0ABP0Y041_9ROSI
MMVSFFFQIECVWLYAFHIGLDRGSLKETVKPETCADLSSKLDGIRAMIMWDIANEDCFVWRDFIFQWPSLDVVLYNSINLKPKC